MNNQIQKVTMLGETFPDLFDVKDGWPFRGVDLIVTPRVPDDVEVPREMRAESDGSSQGGLPLGRGPVGPAKCFSSKAKIHGWTSYNGRPFKHNSEAIDSSIQIKGWAPTSDEVFYVLDLGHSESVDTVLRITQGTNFFTEFQRDFLTNYYASHSYRFDESTLDDEDDDQRSDWLMSAVDIMVDFNSDAARVGILEAKLTAVVASMIGQDEDSEIAAEMAELLTPEQLYQWVTTLQNR